MESERNKSYDHVRCPICFFILIEPVTLPCNHRLCLACFDHLVEEVDYTCPICRHRLSNWARNVSREKTLVDEDLWNHIQEEFADVIEAHRQHKRSLGLLAAECNCGGDDVCTCAKKVNSAILNSPGKPELPRLDLARPGEIRREYLEECEKVEKEKLLQKIADEKANEEFILSQVSDAKRKRLLKSYIHQSSKSKDRDDSESDVHQMRSRSATGVSEKDKCQLYRSPSTSSIDSITPETQGFIFKPIHCSPRTPPRRLATLANIPGPSHSGFATGMPYPAVIRSVPRVLDDTSSESSFASSCSSLSNFRGGARKFPVGRRYPVRSTRSTLASASTKRERSSSPQSSVADSDISSLNVDISATSTRTRSSPSPAGGGRASAAAAAAMDTSSATPVIQAGKRKAATSCHDTEKENKAYGTRSGMELPDFKRLRLHSAAGSPIPPSTAAAASCLKNASENSNIFINRRKSGVEFLSLEAYRCYMEEQKMQAEQDYQLAKQYQSELERNSSSSPDQAAERTYSLRKRKAATAK